MKRGLEKNNKIRLEIEGLLERLPWHVRGSTGQVRRD